MRCGLCCYEREVGEDGSVAVDLSDACEFLDPETHLCRVYERRFESCDRCHQLTPKVALSATTCLPAAATCESSGKENKGRSSMLGPLVFC